MLTISWNSTSKASQQNFLKVLDEFQQAPVAVDAVHVKVVNGSNKTAAVMKYESSRVLPFNAAVTSHTMRHGISSRLVVFFPSKTMFEFDSLPRGIKYR